MGLCSSVESVCLLLCALWIRELSAAEISALILGSDYKLTAEVLLGSIEVR